MNLHTILAVGLALFGIFCAGMALYHARQARVLAERRLESLGVRQRGFADNGAEIEARMQRDAATLDCPACGGSGHFDDTDDEGLLAATVRGFTEGMGASEDHELIRHHFTRLGLPDDLVTTIMQRIVPQECRDAFNETIRQKIRTLDATMGGDAEGELVETLDTAIQAITRLQQIRDQLDLALHGEPEVDPARTIDELIAAARRRVDRHTEARRVCMSQRQVIDGIKSVLSRAGVDASGPDTKLAPKVLALCEAKREAGGEFRRQLTDAVLALQAAWPYVHGWCTIEAKRKQIGAVLMKHGNFADMDHVQRAVREAQPVAYGIFADIPDEGWVLQFPNYREKIDAERAAGTFCATARIEVRPLYA
jgi:hypothetical protein